MSYAINKCDPCNSGHASLCTGDLVDNIWYQDGVCKLDQLTYDQVEFVLLRNPDAKRDLLRVTSDPTLIQLAHETGLVADEIEDGMIAYRIINNPKQTLPFYTVLRGNIDGTIF
jgi:hypothetical protein